jgi:hypothetical protein
VGHEDGFALYSRFLNRQDDGGAADARDAHQSFFKLSPIAHYTNDQAIIVHTYQQVASLGVGKGH